MGLPGLDVPFHHVELLDENPALLAVDLENAADLPLFPAGDHLDDVVFADLQLVHGFHFAPPAHRTSGAREIIFMNFLSRSSRATGPKIRVPRGSSCSLIMTAALSLNRIREPSLRFTGALVLTTTALHTSDFLTVPPGMASLTATTMMSP